jgi:hypothetical protein
MKQIFKFWTYFKWNNFSNSEQILNRTNFQILNKIQMEQIFKFWTYFKWNKFSNSEHILNGTIF